MKSFRKFLITMTMVLCQIGLGDQHPTGDKLHGVPPVVSASWLADNLGSPDLVVVDIRDAPAYSTSHIPGSLSIPFSYTSLWARNSTEDVLVMPPENELRSDLAAQGLAHNKRVVLVVDTSRVPNSMIGATRVASTLLYAGFPLENVGILDGGFPAWVAAGQSTSAQPVTPKPTNFTGTTNSSFIVDRAYVHSRIGMIEEGVILLDVRGVSAYNNGHIQSAISLPLTSIWDSSLIFKSDAELLSMFKSAVGNAPNGKSEVEVIVYCTQGFFASAWFYVLSNILGYQNVKLYDGSTQDWIKQYPLVKN